MASKRFRDAVGIDPDRVVSAAVDAALGESQSRPKKHHPGRVLAAGAALAAAAAVGQRRMPRLAKVPLRMGLHKLGDMAHVDDLADAVRDRLTGHRDEPDDDYVDEEEEFDDDEEEEFDDEPRDEGEDLPEDEDDDFDEDGEDDEDDEDDDEGFDDEPEDDGGPRGEGDELDEDEDEEPEDDEPLAEDEEPEDDEPLAEDEEPVDEDPEAADEDEEDEDLEPEDEDEDEDIAARSVKLGLSAGSNGPRVRGRVPDLFEALRTPHRRAPVMRHDALRVDPATRPPKPDDRRGGAQRRDRQSKNTKSKAARA
jgi:hypothetical protein